MKKLFVRIILFICLFSPAFVLAQELDAEFEADVTSINADDTVNFTDLSAGYNIIEWSWTFEGGSPPSSTSQNPSVTYNTAGIHDVSLTVANRRRSDTETIAGYIIISGVSAPTANFSANNTSVTEGGAITFSDLSTDNPASWSWIFNGGTPSASTSQNPTVIYNSAGTYTVSLTATNSSGSDTETKVGYITVTGAPTAGDYTVVDGDQSDCFDTTGDIITCGSAYDGQDAQYTTVVPNYTNNEDGTVTDNSTGLIWQRHHSEKMSWDDSITYCDGLGLGGSTDWRVPTVKELYSLIDFDGYTGSEGDMTSWKLYLDGSMDPDDDYAVFIQEPGNTSTGERFFDAQVRTSTDPVGTTMMNDDSVLGVNFLDGRIKAYPKNAMMYTRCVQPKFTTYFFVHPSKGNSGDFF
ncbi:MAG: DUF1566 domain-containing protein [Desulfobacteraceae bacterium]|nr:DUF1566 domain-containing protein [Desulfobacteraceae bacterium]